MKTYTSEELKTVLEKHLKWLQCDGGERANLSFADLSSANLSSANLRSANLSFANLRFANLSFADLSSANLRFADLSSANLRSANLSSANLRFADLSSANLRFADLSSANLRSANLSFADLSFADLQEAKTDDRYISISGIGSAKRMTIFNLTKGVVVCGCFKGTIKEFEEKVKETHKENPVYLKEYLGAISYIKSLM